MLRITHIYSHAKADYALQKALKNGMKLSRTADGLTELDIAISVENTKMTEELIHHISNFHDRDHLRMLQGILSEVNKMTSSDIVKLYERLMTEPPGNNPKIASTEEDFKEEFKVDASELANVKLFIPSGKAYETTIIY